jgi:hypothetical protein
MNKLAKRSAEWLSFDSMYGELQAGFEQLNDHRGKNSRYSLQDILSSAFAECRPAMFSLKSASLLDFSLRSKQEDNNLMNVFNITRICSDTQTFNTLKNQGYHRVGGPI